MHNGERSLHLTSLLYLLTDTLNIGISLENNRLGKHRLGGKITYQTIRMHLSQGEERQRVSKRRQEG